MAGTAADGTTTGTALGVGVGVTTTVALGTGGNTVGFADPDPLQPTVASVSATTVGIHRLRIDEEYKPNQPRAGACG